MHGRILTKGTRIVSAGRRITTAGSRILSEGRRIVTAGTRIVSEGRRIATAGTRIVVAGRRIVTTGSRIVSEGRRIVTAGTRILLTETGLCTYCCMPLWFCSLLFSWVCSSLGWLRSQRLRRAITSIFWLLRHICTSQRWDFKFTLYLPKPSFH